jgi:glutamate---cysteine ligase / carboxylate-amine ligase
MQQARQHAQHQPASAGRLAAFAGSTQVTIGVEEEYFTLDAATGAPRWDAPALVDSLADTRFKRELPAAQIEHLTPPCRTLAEVEAHISGARRDLAAAAPGWGFAAAGTHPTAATVSTVPSDPRYLETLALHGWAARQQLVAALQVHVAIRPAAIALAVHDALRSYLPELIAISASAPFHAGRDTGLATVRPLIATLLPRQGVPPAFGSLEEYHRVCDWMAAAGVEERRLWWEVRLRPAYGTLEIRAMDSQPTARRAAAIAAFAASLAVWLADRARAGERLPVHPTERIEENRWRAIRWGSGATLLDLESADEQALEARIEVLLEALAPVASQLGAAALLGDARVLLEDQADAQREVAARYGVDEVSRWLATRFAT